IEVGQSVLGLRTADDIYGVISREHDTHVTIVVAPGDLEREALRIRRRGVSQFVHEGLHGVVVSAAFLTNVAVGADSETVKQNLALLSPLRERLREEGKTRDKQQYEAPVSR